MSSVAGVRLVRLTRNPWLPTSGAFMTSLPPKAPRSRLQVTLGIALRVALTALVFGVLFWRIDVHAVTASIARIPVFALLSGLGALVLATLTAVVRWRALMLAYGAIARPSWRESLRLYWVTLFYNLLPGAVGGDVYRGYTTRHYFADGAATRSMSVVFVERVFGFSGLLVLAAAATLLGPAPDRQVLLVSGLGLCAACGAVLTLVLGRRLAHLLPGRLAKLAGSLPRIERTGPFAWAFGLSVVTHIIVALSGHVLIHSLASTVTLNDSMSIFPIGTLAAYFPLSIAGAGARDAALAILFAKIGVAKADALATSLCMLGSNLIVSGAGGLVQLFGNRKQVPGTRSELGLQ
ncbi:MAG: hypothetical protein JWN04_3368 [Myxococcaceae bacterium]|nr:hypothetical protein [Myxococcaceae bacterium]